MSKRRVKKSGPKTPRGARRVILDYLKQNGGGLVSDIASHARITYEGARRHLTQLEKEKLVEKEILRPERASAGRPTTRYTLNRAGDNLFPKSYDELSVQIIDAIVDRLGASTLKQVLGALTDKRVEEWEPRVEGKSIKDRVVALQQIYGDGDEYMSAEIGRDGIRLIERNCPFFNVASRRPALCSITVSTLQRLLGVQVVREERFQAGHGRCVFRVLPDKPIDTRKFRFALEAPVVVKK